MAVSEGIVGQTFINDGAQRTLRLGRTGEQAVQMAHGGYYEPVSRGKVYHASMQAGASLGTALTATAVTLTLYNPATSGVNLSLMRVRVGVTTFIAAGAGPLTTAYVLAANTNVLAAAPTATTSATIRNSLLGGAAGVGLAYTAATLPAAPVVVRSIGSLYLIGATLQTSMAYNIDDWIDGEIVVAPNTAITLQAIGSATSGIVSMSWEEIPIQ